MNSTSPDRLAACTMQLASARSGSFVEHHHAGDDGIDRGERGDLRRGGDSRT